MYHTRSIKCFRRFAIKRAGHTGGAQSLSTMLTHIGQTALQGMLTTYSVLSSDLPGLFCTHCLVDASACCTKHMCSRPMLAESLSIPFPWRNVIFLVRNACSKAYSDLVFPTLYASGLWRSRIAMVNVQTRGPCNEDFTNITILDSNLSKMVDMPCRPEPPLKKPVP